MGSRDPPNGGIGDTMGFLLANGLDQSAEEAGWRIRSGAALTRAAGQTVMQRVASAMENPRIFIVWSAIELALSLVWLHDPWPLPGDYVTKHPGAIGAFVALYLAVTGVYFMFLRAKAAAFGPPVRDGVAGPAQHNPGLYRDERGISGGLAFRVYSVLGSMVCLAVLVIAAFTLVRRLDLLYVVVKNMLGIGILVLGLAIAYFAMKPVVEKQDGIGRTALDVVMFIPCLAASSVEWLVRQESGKKLNGSADRFYAGKPLVWYVIGVEAALVALRYILPYVMGRMASHGGKQLLSSPEYLNERRTLASYQDLHASTDGTEYVYRYALSAWVYINPQPPSANPAYATFTPLLDFGGKPTVAFNGKTGVLRATVSPNGRSTGGREKVIGEVTDIPYQRWNNIVVNYDGANMDVFFNGELVGTAPNVAPYMSHDDVVVGATPGVYGGVCNVSYYDQPLASGDISLAYRTLRERDFPVV
jgi:hypothetical protein